MWVNEADVEAFPAGWFVSGAGHVTNVVSIIGEVNGSHKSVPLGDVDLEATPSAVAHSAWERPSRVRISLSGDVEPAIDHDDAMSVRPLEANGLR
jgi:hypothetical protein